MKYTTTINIALFLSLRQYFKTFYKKAIIHTEKRTRWQNFMQNNPRTEFEWRRACIAIKRDALVWAREACVAFTSVTLPAAPAAFPPACTGATPGHSWDWKSIPLILGLFKMKKNRRGRSLWRNAYFYSQAELLWRDCTSSGSRDRHRQTSIGENTDMFPRPRVRENGANA